MIDTSRDWRVKFGNISVPNRQRLVPETFIKIEYEQNDPQSQLDAESSATDSTQWSASHVDDLTNTATTYTQSYATLEENEWTLDGTMPLFPTEDFNTGYVSNEVCGSDRTFTNHPKVTIEWDEVQTTALGGITVTFSSVFNEWATDYTVKVYNGNVLRATINVTNNDKVESLAIQSFNNYDKIEIEISKWCLPNHRARIEEVLIGLISRFTKENIVSYEHLKSGDLLAFELPQEYIQFELDNVDSSWNPDNPSGMYSYLLDKQKMTVSYGLDVDGTTEWHTFGTYYMSERDTPQNGITVTFKATSLLEFMTQTFNPSAISGYTYGNSITLYNLVNNAFLQANLPQDSGGANKWSIDNSLQNISVIIPYSAKEEEGVTTYSWEFNYSCAEVVQLCANASCSVIRVKDDGDIAIEPLDGELTDYLIDQFVSYEQGEYSLTKPLKNVLINDTWTTAYSSDGETQSISNDLIQSQARAQEVGAWISNNLGKRKTLSGSFRSDPRVEVYDIIKNENKFAINTIYVTSVKFNYGGAFKADYEGRVIKSIPKSDTEGNYYVGDWDGTDANTYTTYSGGDY